MVPFNLAVYRTGYTSTGDITFLVVDSIVDIIFLIDIVFNFHTSFVGDDGAVIVDEAKIRSNYLRSGKTPFFLTVHRGEFNRKIKRQEVALHRVNECASRIPKIFFAKS